jgi:hypothetical protein
MSLRNPESPFCDWLAAANSIGNAHCHRSHRKVSVEAEAVPTQVAPGVLVKVEGMEGALKLILRLPSRELIQRNCGRSLGCLPPDNRLLVAVCRGHGAEAGQAIGERLAAGHQVAFGPVRDRF